MFRFSQFRSSPMPSCSETAARGQRSASAHTPSRDCQVFWRCTGNACIVRESTPFSKILQYYPPERCHTVLLTNGRVFKVLGGRISSYKVRVASFDVDKYRRPASCTIGCSSLIPPCLLVLAGPLATRRIIGMRCLT